MKRKIMLIIFIFISTIVFAEKLVFVGANSLNAPIFKWFGRIEEEALSRLGYEFEFKEVPAKRASVILNSGEVDADLARVYSYGASFKNIVRVEEKMNTTTFAIYATDENIKIDGWKGLQGTNYKVEFKRGVLIAEKTLPKFVAKKNIDSSPNFEVGIKKLSTGRVDIYIGNSFRVDLTVKNLRKSGQLKKEVYKVGVAQEIPIHPYLHKRHAALAPKFAEVLRDMKAEGRFEELRIEVGLPEGAVEW